MKMPHKGGVPDGLIALWGNISLVPLDQHSVKILAEGKSPKKGLLIDWLANFERSAKQGLPIYRIAGGPGFVWAASFDQKGRATLRTAAVDASAFAAPPPEPQAGPQPAAGPQLTAPESQSTADNNDAAASPPELKQTIEKLQAELAIAATRIAELETAKAAAEVAVQTEAAKARIDAAAARTEIAQAGVAEKAKSDAATAGLQESAAVATATAMRWEGALYGAIGGLLVALTLSAVGFFMSRQRRRKAETTPILALAQPQTSKPELELFASSPAISIAEDIFGRELEEQVAAINATHAEIAGEHKLPVETHASSESQAS
jgi:hypothetical protein